MTLRSKRVPQKVKALCASLFDAGLCLVQRELDPLHHTTRPIQRLFRTTAAENHEIIGVVHDSGSEHLTPTVIRQYFRKRFMYRFASSGLITPPCGVPQMLCLPPLTFR